ncbi:DUF805 domain-containing protein [Qipengyuania sp. DGS5-3]|uniref:DUF805 domain-containing protein n=1 Tax=Qipengyuania sp. DGS5-3 TaxID=3349632 RepID=UPI0036D3D35B
MLDRLVGYRINRATYWTNLLLIIAFVVAVIALDFTASSLGMVTLVVFTMLAALRLHDIGKTAKIALFGALLLSFLQIAGLVIYGIEQALMIAGTMNLVVLLLLVWLGAIKGDPAANAWGDPPPPGISWQRPKPS